MKVKNARLSVAGSFFALALLMTGCSTAAVGVGAVSAVADAVASNSHAKSSRLRAEMQTDMQAFEEAQLPKFEETQSSYLRVITQMQKEGMWFASLAHIDALESQWKVSEHSRLLRADALRHTGNAAMSSALYKQLLGGQFAARAWHGLGLLAAADGQFDLAVEHLQSAQKKSPTNALLLNDLGFALLHTTKGAHAALPLKQAAQLEPTNTRIQTNLALYLVMFGQTQEALAWMNQTAMTKEHRERVFATAQMLASEPAKAAQPINALALPDIPKSSGCGGCLIFEKNLAVNLPAS